MDKREMLKIEIKRLREDIDSSKIEQVRPYINGKISVREPKKHLQEHLNLIEVLIEDLLEVHNDKIQT